MKVLTRAQTRRAEEYAYALGLGSERLMENAGSAASKIIREQFALNNKRVVVLTGQGNNGGDGFVVSRKLKECGAKVFVITASSVVTAKNALAMQSRAVAMQIPMFYYYDNINMAKELISSADIIVDAIFGIGFHGAAESDIKNIIDCANRAEAEKISLDIPSGVVCDTGEVLGSAFKADITVSFIGYKPCHFSYPAADYCGKLFNVNLGFELEEDFESFAEVAEYETAKAALKDIPRNAHKGTKGTLVVCGGSYGMAGAVIFSARAAMRSGAGIVNLVIPDSIYPIVATAVPEAVCTPLTENKKFLFEDSCCENILKKANAVVIGPGMGNNEHTEKFLNNILSKTDVPTVIDADGLNILADKLSLLKNFGSKVIVTPHPGEMARLLNTDVKSVEENRIKCAEDFSLKFGVITVLKGAYTVIATPSGKCYINTTGCSGMATAGSGDMLAGMIGAFLANGTDMETSAVSAVCLHGVAGERAAGRLGIRGVIVSDMIEQLPLILN